MFIIDVLGANLVIGFGIFVYFYMSVFTQKNVMRSVFAFTEDEYNECFSIILSLVWPIVLACIGIYFVFSKGFPFIYKCFDKIVPKISIKIEKEE